MTGKANPDLTQRPWEEARGLLEAHMIRGWDGYIMLTMVNVIKYSRANGRMRGPASIEGLG